MIGIYRISRSALTPGRQGNVANHAAPVPNEIARNNTSAVPVSQFFGRRLKYKHIAFITKGTTTAPMIRTGILISVFIKTRITRISILLVRNRFVQVKQHIGDGGHGRQFHLVQAFWNF